MISWIRKLIKGSRSQGKGELELAVKLQVHGATRYDVHSQKNVKIRMVPNVYAFDLVAQPINGRRRAVVCLGPDADVEKVGEMLLRAFDVPDRYLASALKV